MASLASLRPRLLRLLTEQAPQGQVAWCRRLGSSAVRRDDIKSELVKAELAGESKELELTKAKRILQDQFPDRYRDGKFVSRMSYVEFIDEALAKLKDFGLERDPEAYKELLRVFPPGKYFGDNFMFGLFHAPQQLAALRVLHQMQMNGVKPDRDFELIILNAFSNRSDIWLKIIRANYWSMKFRNADPNPLPEKLPPEPHQLAKLAIERMLDDRMSVITVTNTSRVADSVDKTWLVYSQSTTQKGIIEKLDDKATLYIEEGGLSYVDRDYLAYYHLKFYVDDATRARKQELHEPKPDFNFNKLRVQFFGKPIREKYELLDDAHYVDGSYILSTVATGTSSQDSLLSWLKLLQQRNPKLGKLNVVFKHSRKPPELIEYSKPVEERTEEEERAYKRRQHDQSVNMML